jgi:hypothetical protein
MLVDMALIPHGLMGTTAPGLLDAQQYANHAGINRRDVAT